MKNLISFFYGISLFSKNLLRINYRNLFFFGKASKKKKKILIASNTVSAIHLLNLELYFSRIFNLGNYPVVFILSNGSNCPSLLHVERGRKFNLKLKNQKLIEQIQCSLISNLIIFCGLLNKVVYKIWPKLNNLELKKVEIFVDNYRSKGIKLKFLDCEIHEHTKSTLIRYLGEPIRNNSNYDDSFLENLYIEFLKIACITSLTWEKIISREKPDFILLNQGLYVPQGIIVEIAKKYHVKLKTFHPGYRKNTILLGEGDTYHKTLLYKNIDEILENPLSKSQLERIERYLQSRRVGREDQISFLDKRSENLRIPNNIKKLRNLILILTNVSWDAQCHYENNTYSSMEEWILDIIDLAKKNPSHNFLFRCHPAEINGRRKSFFKTGDFIRSNSNKINNISIVDSDNILSTYKLIDISSAVIVYATKTAIEASCLEKPVLVCGESFIKGKKITLDLYEKDNLDINFKKLIKSFKVNKERALRYAYYYFFREMKELPVKKILSNEVELSRFVDEMIR